MLEQCAVIKLKKDLENELKKNEYTNLQREGQRKKDIFNLKHQTNLMIIDKSSDLKTTTSEERKREKNVTALSRLSLKEMNQLLCTQKGFVSKDWNRPVRIRKQNPSSINDDSITEKGMREKPEYAKKKTENKGKDLRSAQVPIIFHEKSECELVEKTNQTLNHLNCIAEEHNLDNDIALASAYPSCRRPHFLQTCYGDKIINIQSNGFNNKQNDSENFDVKTDTVTYCKSPLMDIQQSSLQGDNYKQIGLSETLPRDSNSNIPRWIFENHIKPSQHTYIVAMVSSAKVGFGQDSNSGLGVNSSNEKKVEETHLPIGKETTRNVSFSRKRNMNNVDCNRETSISMKSMNDVIPICDINNSLQRKLKNCKLLTHSEWLCLQEEEGIYSNYEPSFTGSPSSQNRLKYHQGIIKPTINVKHIGTYSPIHKSVMEPRMFTDDVDDSIGKRWTDTNFLGIELYDGDENYPESGLYDPNLLYQRIETHQRQNLSAFQEMSSCTTDAASTVLDHDFICHNQAFQLEKYKLQSTENPTCLATLNIPLQVTNQNSANNAQSSNHETNAHQFPMKEDELIKSGFHANETTSLNHNKTEKQTLSDISLKTGNELIKNSDCSSGELFSTGKHGESKNEVSNVRLYCDGSTDEEKEVGQDNNKTISSDKSNIPNITAECYIQRGGQNAYTVPRSHHFERNETSSLQSQTAATCIYAQNDSLHRETVRNLHESPLGIVKAKVSKANCPLVLRKNSGINECTIRKQLLQRCKTEVMGGDKKQVKEFLKAERNKEICTDNCGVILNRILKTCIKDGKLKYTKDINERQRKGGFGTVTVCEAVYWTDDGNLAVFKFIKKRIKRKHFNEAEVIFNMDYADTIQGLMQFYGVIIEDGTHVSVLQEYFPGKTLADFIKESGNNVGLKEIIAIFYNVLQTVNLLHCEEIVHWDIKGSNIMVQPSNSCHGGFIVKLIDLGSAKDLRLLHQNQNFGNGTKINNPPEWEKILIPSRRNERILKARDTWCLGIVLYCLLKREGHILSHSMRKDDFIATESYRVYGQINTIDQLSDQGLPCAVHLLTLLLECEPYIRTTVAGAIGHPLFADIRKQALPTTLNGFNVGGFDSNITPSFLRRSDCSMDLFQGQNPFRKITIFFEGQVIFVKYFQDRCWRVQDFLKDKLFMDQIRMEIRTALYIYALRVHVPDDEPPPRLRDEFKSLHLIEDTAFMIQIKEMCSQLKKKLN